MRTDRFLKATAALAIVVGATAALAGCTTTAAPSSDAKAYLLRSMAARAINAETVMPEQTLSDLVPSHEFSIEGSKAEPLAEGIVVGRITSVDAGEAYKVDPNNDLASIQLDYADPSAEWRVAVLTVKTDTRLGDVGAKTIRVGYVIDGTADLSTMEQGLESLGRVTLVLNPQGKFDFDPTLYSVRQSGALLGTVASDGTISFPALGHDESEFLAGADSVQDLVAEDDGSTQLTKVAVKNNGYVRTSTTTVDTPDGTDASTASTSDSGN